MAKPRKEPARTRSHTRHPDDWYVEPPEAVEALAGLLAPKMTGLFGRRDLVWDPCCGSGTIPRVFEAHGMPVCGSDIVDRGTQALWCWRDDFLDPALPPPERGRYANHLSIAMNPPYKDSEAFVRRALDVATHYVAALLPLSFLSSRARHPLFTQRPPHADWVSLAAAIDAARLGHRRARDQSLSRRQDRLLLDRLERQSACQSDAGDVALARRAAVNALGTLRVYAGSREGLTPGGHQAMMLAAWDRARSLGLRCRKMDVSRCTNSQSRYVTLEDRSGRVWTLRISDHTAPRRAMAAHFELVSRDGIGGRDALLNFVDRIAEGSAVWFDPKPGFRRLAHRAYARLRKGGR